VCGQVFHLAAIHPREEPDALMSARPDLCGGHRATSVPTAIENASGSPEAMIRDRRDVASQDGHRLLRSRRALP